MVNALDVDDAQAMGHLASRLHGNLAGDPEAMSIVSGVEEQLVLFE